MIINKGQAVPENEDLEVSESGNYTNYQLVPCCRKGEGEAICAFQAQFITGGADVYSE